MLNKNIQKLGYLIFNIFQLYFTILSKILFNLNLSFQKDIFFIVSKNYNIDFYKIWQID